MSGPPAAGGSAPGTTAASGDQGTPGGDRAATGRVSAVCLAASAAPDAGRVGRTGIDKRPQSGPVEVGPRGLAGDTIADTEHHGGLDQAVYAYADADAHRWAVELGRELLPGSFGENLRVSGIPVSEAVVGERWQLGEPGVGPLLEVTAPRTPCATFQRHLGEQHWVRRFTERGATGAYLRVVEPGVVRAGDAVTVVATPRHGVRLHAWFTGRDPADARRLLDAEAAGELRLHDTLRRQARKAAG